MADIGALPTKTTVRITSTTGDFGTIPAATASSAGVMTADQVQKLERLWQFHETNAGGGTLVVHSQPAVDTSQFPTRLEIQQALSALPKAQDPSRIVAAMRAQVDDLHRQLRDMSANAMRQTPLIQNEPTGEVSDARARAVLDGVIQGMNQIDDRLTEVEKVISILRSLASYKAAMVTEAA